jgi:hypothetical protein
MYRMTGFGYLAIFQDTLSEIPKDAFDNPGPESRGCRLSRLDGG